jgi:predicted double-glycine peptidase
MKKFRLLMDTRQSTEYSCGASALQAVLSYWGKDIDEEELMKLLHTTPETGTYPEDIVKTAQELGFEANVKENLSLDDLEDFTKKGNPAIILGQAWISQEESKKAVTNDWEDGHYVVILAVDKDYVYLEDPFVRMGKGFIPREKFEEHWHNVGGRTPKDATKQEHVGIFIKGKKPAKHQTFRQMDLKNLDFAKIAPLHLGVIMFKGELMPYDLMKEMQPILQSEFIKLAAFIMLSKDKEGRLTAMEGGGITEEVEIIEIDAIMAMMAGLVEGGSALAISKAESAVKQAATGDFGLSGNDILSIGTRLSPDSSAIILLIELLWARKLKDIISKHGGIVGNQQILTEATLAGLWDRLQEAGRVKK